ncbi:MAG TPA: hypothetical protein VJ964_07225 [Balneolaceae bacterium]|nr:hypothetical protein [Balneolaceae bacterium]
MKTFNKILKQVLAVLSLSILPMMAFGQQITTNKDLQYWRPYSQDGLNVFEDPFTTNVKYDGFFVRIGAANTIQFQGLSQENNAAPTDPNAIPKLETNFNLPESNLDIDAQLDRGLRMHLRTYLSSQHHTEAYVKGGYLQLDSFDFIKEGFLSELSNHIRIKVGLMEINYGDNHFRRTDNGMALYNPFVGNYIMDSFVTQAGGELYVYGGNVFGMIGVTNGKMNQNVTDKADMGFKTHASILAKLGYDNHAQQGLRFRLTGSLYTNSQSGAIHLYDGDRAGTRYYHVIDAGNAHAGRFYPTFTPGYGQPSAPGEITSFMINPFIKYQGLEFYGVFEDISGKISTEPKRRNFNQYAGELIYRFGANNDFYLGGRYNVVDGKLINGDDITIDRVNIGGGWFMTKNVETKIEYVSQTYDGFTTKIGDPTTPSIYQGAKFNGVMIEAVVAF